MEEASDVESSGIRFYTIQYVGHAIEGGQNAICFNSLLHPFQNWRRLKFWDGWKVFTSNRETCDFYMPKILEWMDKF
jgi:hypothetical protein